MLSDIHTSSHWPKHGARSAAEASGSRRYHGNECHVPGHGCLRYTASGRCVACVRERV